MPFRSIEDPSRLRRVLEAVLLLEADLDLSTLLRHIVEEARTMTGASYAALGVLNAGRTGLSEFVTAGLSDDAEGRIGARPKGLGVLGLLITDPKPLRLSNLGQHPSSHGFPPNHPPMTSFLGVPILMRGEVFGNLYLTDKIGEAEFTLDDETTVAGLAVAAGIAVENAHLHQQVQEVAVLADRDRLARDLHDKVIQRLYGAGLILQGAAARTDPQSADKLLSVVDELDATIREIRNAIFELAETPGPGGLRSSVLLVLRESESTMPYRIESVFDGPVDTVVSRELTEHLLAVLREALTNIARHADATETRVEIVIRDDQCWLTVRDNGRGLAPDRGAPGRGLKNMRTRAEGLQGTMELIGDRASGGTVLSWRVPLQLS
jgi:signal transduction histidine kinase